MTITAEALGKRFNRDWIFKDLSCSFSPGNIYAITGPNGSGKSTLLQVLWGQLPPTVGRVQFSMEESLVSPENVYRQISIAAPYMDLIDELTLLEHIQLHFKLRKPIRNLSVDDFLDRTYLQDARNKQVHYFSSGMKQRLKLGLAFFTESNLLFLDEPGTNLDEQALNWYNNLLNSEVGKRLVLIASNQPQEYPNTAIMLNLLDFKG